MLKVGTILRGIYRIDSYLSSGGFGNTYIATNIEFDERVAIKEFFMKGVTQRDDNQTTVSVSNSENTNSFLEQKEKFKKEARRIRQLKNEHIIAVHDLFEENSTAYYVMDYVEGENLAQRLKRTGKPLTELEVRYILPQILNALRSVHDAGIWHLDLKPANIMVNKFGNVKLIDFGASKQLNTQKGGATTSTAISYTNGYAPREQMEQNYDKFGPWTDIYALGATLYNLLTNKRPPLPTDIDDDESEDKHKALPFPDSVSVDTKSLVLMMLNTNRLLRPQSINDIISVENSRNVFSRQNIKQNTISQSATNYIDEETIIAEQKNIKSGTNSKQESNLHPSRVVNTESVSYTYENENKSSKYKSILLTACVGCTVLLLLYFGLNGSTGSTTESSSIQTIEAIPPQIVDEMQFTSAIGDCQYSGPVDEYDLPHGRGKALFNDGRYYKGGFEHGVLSGDDCCFDYPNGDEFKGKFRNNSFYYGTYTIASDKSYFTGYYNNGQPSSGHWYDKKGKMLE